MLLNSTVSDSLIDSSTLSSTLLYSSTIPVRKRTVVNAIYIAGIAFMIGIFLLLLWVNLFSRHCWCWHDTPVVNRFNGQWLLRQQEGDRHAGSSSKDRRQPPPSNDDDLPWTFFSLIFHSMQQLTNNTSLKNKSIDQIIVFLCIVRHFIYFGCHSLSYRRKTQRKNDQ